MSQKEILFNEDEVRALIHYSRKVASEMTDNLLKNSGNDAKYEEVNLKLFRRYARLLVYPELILAENPPEKYKPREGPLSIEDRELFYWLLGNRSHKILSLSDEELIDEMRRQLRNFR
jgi:hypothetical protein